MKIIPAELQKIKIEEEFSKFSHIRIGSALPYFFAPHSYEQLKNIMSWAHQNKLTILPVGAASNILMGTATNTAVILVKNLPRDMKFTDRKAIFSANLNINYILMQAKTNKLGGLEFLAGIPANLGGIIKMNAGAYGQNIADFLQNVTVMELNGKIRKYERSELEFGYRHSNITGVILAAELKIRSDSASHKKVEEFLQKRQAAQPLKSANLGCFFKNPPLASAGKLIEDAGLKGYTYQDMQVSNKHANFLINKGYANFSDAWQLIEIVKQKVSEKFSVELELEVQVVR